MSETAFRVALRIIALFFGFVGLLHLTLGLHAEALLGVSVSAEALSSAGLDSQNRFYGVALTLNGVLAWMYLRDRKRYEAVFSAMLAVMFAAGLARLVSFLVFGTPPPAIVALWLSELVLPPVFAVWRLKLPHG